MRRRREAQATRGTTLVAAASMAVLLLSVPSTSARQDPSRRARSCHLRVHAADDVSSTTHHARRAARRVSEFPAYETATLEFDLLCVEAPIAEKIRVELHLPEGALYRELTIDQSEIEGPAPNRKGPQLQGTVRFPVRGTFVTQNRLFGRWSAKLCREVGSQRICETGVSFALLED